MRIGAVLFVRDDQGPRADRLIVHDWDVLEWWLLLLTQTILCELRVLRQAIAILLAGPRSSPWSHESYKSAETREELSLCQIPLFKDAVTILSEANWMVFR
jgi:hypothetical protein